MSKKKIKVLAIAAVTAVVLLLLIVLFPPLGWTALVGVVLVSFVLLALRRPKQPKGLESALENLVPDEVARWWWFGRTATSFFPGAGRVTWVAVTTERVIVSTRRSNYRSIPFGEIYYTTQARDVRELIRPPGQFQVQVQDFVELDLVNGEVVRIPHPRPHVLRQQIFDAVAEW